MLGAMDDEKNLTPLGRVLLQIPVDAAIGKLCLFGSFFRCLDSALTLAAALTTRDPFMAPPLRKHEAQRVKDSWSPLAFRSDALAIVAAYNTWNELDRQGDYNRTMQWCHDNFLSRTSLFQMKQIKESLLSALQQVGVITVSAGGVYVPRMRRMAHIPPQLNENGNSLPLLAALISVASAPNFAIRTSDKACRTSQDPVSRRNSAWYLTDVTGRLHTPKLGERKESRSWRTRASLVFVQPCRKEIIRLCREILHSLGGR